MDLELLGKGLEYAKKKKRWVVVLGALGITGYGAYRVYNLPSVVKKRQRFLKLVYALVSVAEMVSDSAEAIGILSKDMKEFLKSDSDQVPQSLRQLSKIAKSNEFSESLTRITRALTVGVLGGYRRESAKDGNSDSGFPDRVLDKVLSDAGSGFASAVVGSFARNLVMGFYDGTPSNDNLGSRSEDYVSRWIDVACEDKCRELIGECVQLFVSTAVAVYLDKTMHISTYDELFTGLTNPKHEAKVRDLLVSVCSGAIETLVRTSHHVWSTNTSKSKPTYSKIDFEESYSWDEKAGTGKKRLLMDKNQDSGWVSKVSSTLAVPSNRKFVIDMTGTVTSETVRSFLDVSLQKLSESVKRNVDAVNQEVVDRGAEIVRYASGKSYTMTTVCIALCLNILNSPWILACH